MFSKSIHTTLAALALSAAVTAGDSIACDDTAGQDAAGENVRSVFAAPRALGGVPLSKWQRGTRRAAESVALPILLPAARPIEPETGDDVGPRSLSNKVGYVEDFQPEWMPAWPWDARGDGSEAGAIELFSANTCGLRVRLQDFDRTAAIEIRFYDPASDTVYGPFKNPPLDEDGGWWSPTIWSSTMGIELFAESGLRHGARPPRIAQVAYISMGVNCGTTPGATLNCHNDVNCSPAFAGEASGVALIYFTQGGSCFRCSGALLNRQPGDFSPLFITASHCISGTAAANSAEIYWFYETSTCNGSAPATPAGQPITLGAALLKQQGSSDFTLLGLAEPPPAGAAFLGWNSANWNNNETAVGIHHPLGSFKRISFGDTGGNSNRRFCDANGNNCFNADVRNVNYFDGTTEPGSSGSPIFDAADQIRGVLSGGDNGCPNDRIDMFYGRFDLAYANLKFFMSNASIASPVHVNGAIAGDSNNDGGTEQGSVIAPFNAVREATFAVRNGDEVRITPGTYNQQFTIWRPMTLKRQGSSGVVRIGG